MIRTRLLAVLAVAVGTVVGPHQGLLAQQVAVRAYVTPGAVVGVGAPFVLNVEVTGVQRMDEEPRLPDLGAFAQYLGSNTQTSMQIVNGQRSVTATTQYRFQAMREGSYLIPSFVVVAGGQSLRTEPTELTVSADSPSGAGAGGTVGADDLFVTAEATKTSVREGEPLVVEYRIWTRVDVGSFNFTQVPEPEGFWVEDVTPAGQPQVEQLVRNGQQYVSAVIRRVVLVPTGAGTRTIEPIVLEAQVRTRSNDPFDRFFGRTSVFGGGSIPVGVLSDPIDIEVLPLPAGAPEPFSGVVGTLSVGASLDRDSVNANEAVTLTVRVSGDGNIRAVQAPELDLPDDFEVFPPEVTESVRPAGAGLTGEKTFEYVLIPRAPGEREIPRVAMSFLDEDAGEYRVVGAGPLALTVGGVAVEGPGALARGGVAELRQDIRFIHLGAALQPIRGPIHEGSTFWLLLLLPMVAVAGAVALRRHRDLLAGDVAYARGRRAARVALKRLKAARDLAGGDDARAFYAEVATALRGLVADRLNVAEAGLDARDLRDALDRRNVDAELIEELQACLDTCDRYRFAPDRDDGEARGRMLLDVQDLMTRLDRALAR